MNKRTLTVELYDLVCQLTSLSRRTTYKVGATQLCCPCCLVLANIYPVDHFVYLFHCQIFHTMFFSYEIIVDSTEPDRRILA